MEAQKWVWFTCPGFTVYLDIDDNHVVTHAAPICRWAVGKKIEVLLKWAKGKFGSARYEVFST
jgi:hypothetical protein